MKYEDFKCLSIDKTISFNGSVACLLSGQSEVDKNGLAVNIEEPVEQPFISDKKFLFIAGSTISDISVSSSGRLWATDLHGYIYYSRDKLDDDTTSKESIRFLRIPPSSCDWLLRHIPVCITGEDDDLWIATYKGSLIHYDGVDFSLQAGVAAPIRFKDVGGRKFLMGCHGQLLCYEDGYWVPVLMDSSVPQGTTISDITILDDVLVAVATNGLILRQKEDKTLTLMHRSLGVFWHGCDVNEGIVYLAAGEKGAYKIEDKEIICIDENPTFSVLSIEGVLIFPRADYFKSKLSYYNVLTKRMENLEFEKKEAAV